MILIKWLKDLWEWIKEEANNRGIALIIAILAVLIPSLIVVFKYDTKDGGGDVIKTPEPAPKQLVSEPTNHPLVPEPTPKYTREPNLNGEAFIREGANPLTSEYYYIEFNTDPSNKVVSQYLTGTTGRRYTSYDSYAVGNLITPARCKTVRSKHEGDTIIECRNLYKDLNLNQEAEDKLLQAYKDMDKTNFSFELTFKSLFTYKVSYEDKDACYAYMLNHKTGQLEMIDKMNFFRTLYRMDRHRIEDFRASDYIKNMLSTTANTLDAHLTFENEQAISWAKDGNECAKVFNFFRTAF